MQFFKKIWRSYIRMLDNYKLKSKMTAMYIFCVLLPIIVTDSLVLALVYNSERMEKEKNLENIAEAVAYNLTSSVENAVLVTQGVYINKAVNNFMEKEYKSPLDYYIAYERLKSNYSLHTNFGQHNENVTLYVDNESIVNGSEFAKISTVGNEDWYQYYKNSGLDLVLYYYFDYSKQKLYNIDTSRSFCVIRKLDLYGGKEKEKLMKLDLSYNQIARDIVSTNYSEDVYICDGETIVFSNTGNTAGNKEFETLDPVVLNKVRFKKEINLYTQELTIYVVEHSTNTFSGLKKNSGILWILVLVNMLIPVFVMYGVTKSLSNRIWILNRYFDKVKDEVFEEIDEVTGKDEIGWLMKNYNHMVTRIKELIQVVYKGKLKQQELNLAKQQAELLALHSQVNPHFMFNALESIRMRSVLKQEGETAGIIGELAVLMRKSVNWGADDITIKDELEFVEAYLKIQQYRFGERLSYQIDVEQGCLEYKIPKLTIVTFVENSCVHGIEAMKRPGWIFISVLCEQGDLVIEIEDTGAGMDESQVEALRLQIQNATIETLENSQSIGVLNACIRLKNYSREQTWIGIESEKEVGTTVSIRIEKGGSEEC